MLTLHLSVVEGPGQGNLSLGPVLPAPLLRPRKPKYKHDFKKTANDILLTSFLTYKPNLLRAVLGTLILSFIFNRVKINDKRYTKVHT